MHFSMSLHAASLGAWIREMVALEGTRVEVLCSCAHLSTVLDSFTQASGFVTWCESSCLYRLHV